MSVVCLLCVAARAQTNDQGPPRRPRDAAQTTRDGTFLPTTLAARVGDQHVTGLFLGGYETTAGQGAIFSGVAEAALFHRVALRAGVEYLSATQQAAPLVGVRVGILTQERYGFDLGGAFQYRNRGFTQASGEFEMLILASRRWNRLGVYGNLAYGQGTDSKERDGEIRAAVLYAIHEKANIGLDARARFDLGEETPARATNKLESDFDLLAGPLATLAVGPFMLMAQAGIHTLVQHEKPRSGFAAVAGLGTSF